MNTKRFFWSFLFLLFLAVCDSLTDESDYEYVYYDYSYEDESYEVKENVPGKESLESVPAVQVSQEEQRLPEVTPQPPRKKRGFQQKYCTLESNLDEKFEDLAPLVGGKSWKLLNETMVLYDCWPKGDLKGSRAYETEEMQRIGEAPKPKVEAKGNSNRKKSLQEIQEEKMRKRLEEVTKSKKMVRIFTLGADCETLICGSCKALVEEFSVAVSQAVSDPSKDYLDQVFEGFCHSRSLGIKYHDMVINLCAKQITGEPGFKEAFLSAFEVDTNYDSITSVESILTKKRQICQGFGACSKEQFTFSNVPMYRYQEQWDDGCFVCQAIADDIEERVLLHRRVTDAIAASIVDGTCNRLGLLAGKFNDLCLDFTKGSKGDDMTWITKVYADKVVNKPQTDKRFSDSLCEEMKLCKKWLNEDALSKEKTMKEIEAVFE